MLMPAMMASFHVAARTALMSARGGFHPANYAWRHHGLGMLQAEINDQLRIHVWHPKLKLIDDGLRSVHDHRFDLVSAVIVGCVIDQSFSVAMCGRHENECPVFEIAHAKIQGEGPVSKQVGVARVEALSRCWYRAGSVYSIPRRQFHQTTVEDLAVTVVARTNFDDRPARVLEKGESGIVAPDLSHWRIDDVKLKHLHAEVLEMAYKALWGLPEGSPLKGFVPNPAGMSKGGSR